jgi:hypothetical protein
MKLHPELNLKVGQKEEPQAAAEDDDDVDLKYSVVAGFFRLQQPRRQVFWSTVNVKALPVIISRVNLHKFHAGWKLFIAGGRVCIIISSCMTAK